MGLNVALCGMLTLGTALHDWCVCLCLCVWAYKWAVPPQKCGGGFEVGSAMPPEIVRWGSCAAEEGRGEGGTDGMGRLHSGNDVVRRPCEGMLCGV